MQPPGDLLSSGGVPYRDRQKSETNKGMGVGSASQLREAELMITFVIGVFIGAFIGFILAAVLAMRKDQNEYLREDQLNLKF